MRNLHLLDAFRVNASDFFGDLGDGSCGAFRVSSPIDGGALNVLASSGGGWDHVSVSRVNRCPNWAEMEHIKRMFFREDEAAMQLHVPPAEAARITGTSRANVCGISKRHGIAFTARGKPGPRKAP